MKFSSCWVRNATKWPTELLLEGSGEGAGGQAAVGLVFGRLAVLLHLAEQPAQFHQTQHRLAYRLGQFDLQKPKVIVAIPAFLRSLLQCLRS